MRRVFTYACYRSLPHWQTDTFTTCCLTKVLSDNPGQLPMLCCIDNALFIVCGLWDLLGLCLTLFCSKVRCPKPELPVWWGHTITWWLTLQVKGCVQILVCVQSLHVLPSKIFVKLLRLDGLVRFCHVFYFYWRWKLRRWMLKFSQDNSSSPQVPFLHSYNKWG